MDRLSRPHSYGAKWGLVSTAPSITNKFMNTQGNNSREHN
jgi:hypothetical protein